jgi:hypothetical protein
MAERKDIEIYFKIEGLKTYITDLETLDSVLKQVNAATEEAKVETADLEEQVKNTGKSADKSSGFFGKIGTIGTKAFQGLKTAINATGIGLLITALGGLVTLLSSTDEGAKLLRGTTAAIGVIFERVAGIIGDLSKKLGKLFTDPKQALIDFGTLLKDQLVNRFLGILNLIPALGNAVGLLFKGEFEAAGKVAADAVLQVVTGVTNATDKIGNFVGDLADDIGDAIETTNSLVDAENKFSKLQAKLIVENAKLNKTLEEQKKIAEDTTRGYDERKAALDKVNAANEQLAANALKEAQAEENLIKLRQRLAKTDQERRDLDIELANATAKRIQAEQQVGIVRLESAQLGRELDAEEVERKRNIQNIIEGINAELVVDERAKVEESIRIAREATLVELANLKATQEQIDAANKAFDDLRAQQLQEITDKETAEAEAKAKTITDIIANATKTQSELEYQRLQDELEAQRLADIEKLKQAGATAEQLAAIDAAYAAKKEKLDQDQAEKEKQLEREKLIAKVELAGKAIDAIAALQKAFTSDNEKDAEKNFKIQKALSIASATVQTALAVTAALTAGGNPIKLATGAQFVEASIAAAFGIAQIATIARTKFTPGGSSGGNIDAAPPPTAALPTGTGGGGPTIQPGQTSSGQTPQPEPIRAYVLVSDVNSAQQANTQIENLSKL